MSRVPERRKVHAGLLLPLSKRGQHLHNASRRHAPRGRAIAGACALFRASRLSRARSLTLAHAVSQDERNTLLVDQAADIAAEPASRVRPAGAGVAGSVAAQVAAQLLDGPTPTLSSEAKMAAVESAYSTLPGFEQMTARNKAKIVKAVAAMLKAQTARLSKRATGAGSPP